MLVTLGACLLLAFVFVSVASLVPMQSFALNHSCTHILVVRRGLPALEPRLLVCASCEHTSYTHHTHIIARTASPWRCPLLPHTPLLHTHAHVLFLSMFVLFSFDISLLSFHFPSTRPCRPCPCSAYPPLRCRRLAIDTPRTARPRPACHAIGEGGGGRGEVCCCAECVLQLCERGGGRSCRPRSWSTARRTGR